jgi:TRAP transporter TAXI family solute receptor
MTARTKLPATAKLLATAAIAGLLVAGLGQTASAKLKRISIGTNKAGTTYFVLGGGFAKLFQEKLGIRSNAQPHAGSSVYIPLLDQGEIALGINSSIDSSLAYHGGKPYPRAMTKLRALARIWVLPYGYFVRANSGIKTVEDLKGKKVVIDLKANVSLAAFNWAIMATGGLDKNSLQPIAVGGIGQGLNAVVEGRADAAPIALGIPLLRKADASIPGGIRIIALGKKGTTAFLNSRVGGTLAITTKPSKRNVGVKKPIKVGAFNSFLNVGSQVTDDEAYKLAKVLHENWKALQKDYPPLRGVPANGLAAPVNPHPYHAGAVRYYKEVGLWTKENEKHRAMIMKK